MDTTRLKNALWGAFIADAMAMPVHWYYQRKYIKEGFDGGIKKYEDAPHPHPEAFMVGNAYHPNIAKAKALGRPFDIAHEHIRFYDTNYNDFDVKLSVHAGEHKNAMPEKSERYHYHHGLKAGENTLGANLIRVLIRSIIKEGKYKQEVFIEDFIHYLTTPGLNKDSYTEVYIRAWFENFTNGVPAHASAQEQREVWSIGSNGGIIRPLVLSLTSKSTFQALGVALQHQQITHRSDNVSSALCVLVPLLHKLLEKEEPNATLKEFASKVKVTKISGAELSKTYAEHNGPGNIPKDEMWDIHTEFSELNLDLDLLMKDFEEDEILGSVFTTGCYPEQSLPVLMYLLYKNKFDFEASILANANAGGDCVHRGIILGMLAGAANDEIPQALKEGLLDYESIHQEIEDFVEVIKAK
ncbi:MAG: ADP-ribosylglycohydrolase family protein [Sulfurovum sp.]|nr:ADP-ribosylglycohydrolase family protein [Sulfurovum sp.]